MNLDLNLVEVDCLSSVSGLVNTSVRLRLGQLSPTTRRRAIRYLRTGWVRTSERVGLGLLLAKMSYVTSYPWHLRGALKYRYVSWDHCVLPEEVEEGLLRLAAADRSAALVKGMGAGRPYSLHSHRFRVLDPDKLLPPLLEPWVSHISYQRAVMPLVAMFERGEDIVATVRPRPYLRPVGGR